MIHRTIWIGGGGQWFPPSAGLSKEQRAASFRASEKRKAGFTRHKTAAFPGICFTSTAEYTVPHLHIDGAHVSPRGFLSGEKNGRACECLQESAFSPCPSESQRKKKEEMWRGGSCAGKNKHQKRGATRATQFFHPWNHKKKKKNSLGF